MNSHAAVITVRGLGVRWRKHVVLDDLSLDVPQGSVTALVGSNGAGKSTVLRVLVGALVPNAGHVRVLGFDPSRDGASVRARVGYCADRFEVANSTRGGEWLAFLARFYSTWSAAEQARLVGLLELDLAAKVAELSKGNRTKLALVAALAHEPQLLILDEPFSGLDVETRRAVSTVLLGSLRDEGRTVLLVSHSIADVERVADRIAVLEDGRIVRHGELEQIASTPRRGIDLERALLDARTHEVHA